jgi:hypothetical protein
MNSSKASCTAATAILAAVLGASANAAPPQVRTAPRPVMQNPNRPQADWQSGSQQDQVVAVDVTIETGDDDLRSGSAASLFIGGGQGCVLKQNGENPDDVWTNGSIHNHRCELSMTRSLGELESMPIALVYQGHGQGGFEGQDNWDVTRITISTVPLYPKSPVAPKPAIACLIDVKGRPLVRMTGSSPKFDLRSVHNFCARSNR